MAFASAPTNCHPCSPMYSTSVGHLTASSSPSGVARLARRLASTPGSSLPYASPTFLRQPCTRFLPCLAPSLVSLTAVTMTPPFVLPTTWGPALTKRATPSRCSSRALTSRPSLLLSCVPLAMPGVPFRCQSCGIRVTRLTRLPCKRPSSPLRLTSSTSFLTLTLPKPSSPTAASELSSRRPCVSTARHSCTAWLHCARWPTFSPASTSWPATGRSSTPC
mmetsp:Transcript_10752/g.34102  ORF Transcript_10752/g.34102 Transcript_10752/m.34102 type:complete len:220 (-) Transcript_10752:526-1185(-)